MQSRDPFFDNTKLLLMLLVVLGHVIPIDLRNSINLASYEWIFSFHMPLFVFISGYFTKVGDKRKFWRGILKIFETLVVFTFIHIGISYLRDDSIGTNCLYIPQWTLWYLLSLIWWRMMLYFMPSRIFNNHKLFVCLSIMLCLIAGFIPIGKELSFQRTFSFFPFFVMGNVISQNHYMNKLRWNPFFSSLVLILIWVLFFFIHPRNSAIFYQRFEYSHFNSTLLAFAFRAGLLLLASTMSICFLSLMPRKEYRWTKFGQMTLFIYLWHSVILSWRYDIVETCHIPTSFPFCLLYSLFVLGLIYLMSKVEMFHWILNPLTAIFSRLKQK